MKERNRDKKEEPYQQILSRLAHIEHKVDSIDETNAFALRADEDRHFETVKKIFRKGLRRAQVYLAANGTRGVIEIAQHLGMKQPQREPTTEALEGRGSVANSSMPLGDRTFGLRKRSIGPCVFHSTCARSTI